MRKKFFFYDSPHLIKSVRNNLHKYDIVHKCESSNSKTASWSVISKLYEHDCKRYFKLAPKLTKKSIQLPVFSKMKVSSATRVLSHTVAAAINTLVACGDFPPSASGTAEFCQNMNDLFDVFNSCNFKGPVKLRNAITANSEHLTLLSSLREWIGTWEFRDQNGQNCSRRIKCVSGLKLNIAALELLYSELIVGSDKYLMMRKINQDGLENFFSLMRHKGGFCNNPSPRQFMSAFNNATFCKLFSSTKSINSNCEVVDWSQLISDIKAENTIKFSISLNSQINASEQPALPISNVRLPKALAEANSMQYAFGFIVKKLLRVHHCETCKSVLTDCQSSQLDDSAKIYTNFKRFDTVSEDGSFTVCSDRAYTFLEKCENELEMVYQDYLHRLKCGEFLVEQLMKIKDFPVQCCKETKLLTVKIFVKVRLHYILKFNNEQMQTKGTAQLGQIKSF